MKVSVILGHPYEKRFHRIMFRIIANSTPLQREQWLAEVKETISRYF